MMKNYNESLEASQNPNWPYISDHLCMILIIDPPGLGKANVLLNLIKHQGADIDKVYLYVKDQFESMYQLLITRREKARNKKFKNPKAFLDY